MTNAFVWNLQPEVFSFSPLPRWYSLIFAAGILGGYSLLKHMLTLEGKPVQILDSLLVYVVVGMMLGMRLGHCLFYQPDYYLAHPAEIPMIWRGGYASHGGIVGVVLALALYARRHPSEGFLWLADRVAVIAMFTNGCIRVGNFFNSEMIGRPAEGLPFAVIFAQVDGIPRHPAQLYEAMGYFVVCAIAYAFYRHERSHPRPGQLLGLVLAGGCLWRIFCEFFKENQVPFEDGLTLNMGQLLSLPFVAAGLFLLVRSWRQVATAN